MIQNSEITIITELAGNLKNYLRKITVPKLNCIRNWCVSILNGIDFLYKNDITQVNLSPESISKVEGIDVKIRDLIVDTKLKSSLKYLRKSVPEQSTGDLFTSNQANLIKNFGKLVLYMLFHQSQVYKIVIRLLQSSNKDILFQGVYPEDLQSFLTECLINNKTATIEGIMKHPFLIEEDTKVGNNFDRIRIL